MARKWLGRRKATKKASAMGPAPRMAAMTTSRMKPERRETSVSPPTVAMRLIMSGVSRSPHPRHPCGPSLVGCLGLIVDLDQVKAASGGHGAASGAFARFERLFQVARGPFAVAHELQ